MSKRHALMFGTYEFLASIYILFCIHQIIWSIFFWKINEHLYRYFYWVETSRMNNASINIFIKIHIGVWNISRETAIPYIWYKCTEIACIHTEYSLPTSTLKFCPHISSGGLFGKSFPRSSSNQKEKSVHVYLSPTVALKENHTAYTLQW